MRKGFLLLLLLVSGTLFAQTGDSVITEVYPTDTVAAPVDETKIDVAEDEKEEKNYLLPPTGADRETVRTRRLQAHQLDSLRNRDEYWYWNLKREEEKEEKPGFLERLLQSGFMQVLFWAIIGLACCALIYVILLSLNVNLLRKRTAPEEEEAVSDPEADFYNRDYEGDIARALNAGDHRSAVRLRYLQLLRDLANRNIIQYRHERPNGVYVSQLLGTPYYTAFFRVTRTFEYAWYGEMPVTRAAYDFMQNDIDHLKNRFA